MLVFLIVVATVAIGLIAAYEFWKHNEAARLVGESRVIATRKGPVEFAMIGDAGATVLVIHGSPGGYDQGALLARRAIDPGLRFIAVSRPGYLRTPLVVGRTPEEQGDAYAALLDALGIAKAAIIAISGGGPSALQFCLRHPDRCWGLVLVSALGGRWSYAEQLRSLSFVTRVLVSGLQRQPVMNLFIMTVSCWPRLLELISRRGGTDQELRKRLFADAENREFTQEALRCTCMMSYRRTGLDNDLRQFAELPVYPVAQIVAPTLVLHGTADKNVPFEHAAYAGKFIPGARLVAVRGADHSLYITHKEKIWPAMSKFFKLTRPPEDEASTM